MSAERDTIPTFDLKQVRQFTLEDASPNVEFPTDPTEHAQFIEGRDLMGELNKTTIAMNDSDAKERYKGVLWDVIYDAVHKSALRIATSILIGSPMVHMGAKWEFALAIEEPMFRKNLPLVDGIPAIIEEARAQLLQPKKPTRSTKRPRRSH